MSASASTATAATLSGKQRDILAYLRAETPEQTYFKSRLIGDALDMSAKEVGTNMPAVASAADLEVEKWGYSSSTTWKVTRS
ncbi:MAG: hypothetical protein ABEJ77_06580 [Halanaeroarchaeum sp.]